MIYVLNQKSNMTLSLQEQYLKEIRKYPQSDNVVYAPSFCYLSLYQGLPLASQDISMYQMGAYTGEISSKSLKSLGVSYAIIGHSERRGYFKEDETILCEKLKRAFEEGITPILCIGESEEAYKNKKTQEVLKEELSIQRFFPQEVWKKVILAYEPIWAIGTGKSIQKEELETLLSWIKEETDCSILYGGSVNLETISSFKNLKNLDGFLIGGMSLDVEKVKKLLDMNKSQ